MLLYHTAQRENCASIAEHGLRDGPEGFVHLTTGVWSWAQNWMLATCEIHRIGRREVVFVYDVPDEIASAHLVRAELIGPGHPEYDPEVDGPDEHSPIDLEWQECRIPAEVVNRYFVGLAFWHGDCPLNGDQLANLWRMRDEDEPA